MKAHLIIIPLCLFLIISWALFISAMYIFSKENSELENSLNEVNKNVEYLNEIANTLWDERIFEKEMRENLAYYLPDGFSSKVRYVSLTPLDLELGKARVYFIYRNSDYSVDFSYSFDGNRIEIDRASEAERVK